MFQCGYSELSLGADTTTVLSIFLIGFGVAEFLNNKKIARIFDPNGGDERLTARQNAGNRARILVSGLVLLLLP